MKISYAIPVCNEHAELERVVRFLSSCKRNEDEIVVLCDKDNTTKEVLDIIEVHEDLLKVYYNPLNNDFSQQKNFLNSKCTGDWIFLIDADEYPSEYLIKALPTIIEANKDIEAYQVPKINTVEGLTQEHITKWGWRVDENGWVNFPDWQMRIYKNTKKIYWTKPVHEQLVGHTKFSNLPTEELFCLHHHKGIMRQEKQNQYYSSI